jgi:hypothetical protein
MSPLVFEWEKSGSRSWKIRLAIGFGCLTLGGRMLFTKESLEVILIARLKILRSYLYMQP